MKPRNKSHQALKLSRTGTQQVGLWSFPSLIALLFVLYNIIWKYCYNLCLKYSGKNVCNVCKMEVENESFLTINQTLAVISAWITRNVSCQNQRGALGASYKKKKTSNIVHLPWPSAFSLITKSTYVILQTTASEECDKLHQFYTNRTKLHHHNVGTQCHCIQSFSAFVPVTALRLEFADNKMLKLSLSCYRNELCTPACIAPQLNCRITTYLLHKNVACTNCSESWNPRQILCGSLPCSWSCVFGLCPVI